MGKMIKNKVNGAFAGDAIPFGAIVIHATEGENPTSNQVCLSITGNGQTVSVSSGGYFSETYEGLDDPETRLTTYTISGSTAKTLYFKNGTYDVYVTGKYGGLVGFGITTGSASTDSIFSMDTSEFMYNDDLTEFAAQGQKSFTGKSSDFKRAGTTYIGIQGSNINAKMNDFAECTSLTTLTLPSTTDKDDVMDFVTTQVSLGRSICSDLNVQGIKSYAVFREVTLDYSTNAASLSWNTASKIIVGMGHRKLASASKIYAYGATAEEIAAWQQAGKTVVVVN